ncbi:Hypothetical predicted protein [Olea europaea subsp. europaea]|uniref:Uncharacterized protein n=1 Tax=Olea europaea subsp. europaea TaxID=158383 RepID=A0A8S0SR56_OLEEU|nr:Hypothetical predicted protein [Olea europaea subsp. europaea]
MNECRKQRSDARAGIINEEDEEQQFEDTDPKYDDDDDHEHKEIEPKNGECLVIQRVLVAPKPRAFKGSRRVPLRAEWASAGCT